MDDFLQPLTMTCILGAINLHFDSHYVFNFAVAMKNFNYGKINLKHESTYKDDLNSVLVQISWR